MQNFNSDQHKHKDLSSTVIFKFICIEFKVNALKHTEQEKIDKNKNRTLNYLSKSKYSLEENALFFTTLDLGQMFLNSLCMFPFIQFSSSHLKISPLLQ